MRTRSSAMRWSLIVIILCGATAAKADTIVAVGTRVYAVTSKSHLYALPVTAESLTTVTFVAVRLPGNEGPSRLSWRQHLGETRLEAEPRKATIPYSEGCGVWSPEEWRYRATRVATLLTPLPNGTRLISLPADATVTTVKAKTRAQLGTAVQLLESGADAAQCSESAQFFTAGDTTIAVCRGDDGVNEVIFMFARDAAKPWTFEQKFTVTDACT